MINYFEALSLPPSFDIDMAALDAAYFQLQMVSHPDKTAAKSKQEKIHALQSSMDINMAYETLKNPLKRAQHLLKMQGIIVGSESDNIKPTSELLVEIMELREKLAETENWAEVKILEKEVKAFYDTSLTNISKYYAEQDWQKMAQETIRLGYLIKIISDLKLRKK